MALSLTRARPAFISHAASAATDYVVYVDAPPVEAGDQRLPAVVVLDGDHFFEEAVRELQRAGEIPPLLVAGIGYGRRFGDPGNRRGRDFTPTASHEEPESGGAAAFLQHLATHLWPELERRYALDRRNSVLAGHSLSALFVLYALFQDEPLLRRAIAGAPSIWWDNRSVLAHVRRAHARRDALDAELYVGVGDEETPSMLGDLALFQEQLRTQPFRGLAWDVHGFPERDHYTLLPDLFRGGLRALFGRR